MPLHRTAVEPAAVALSVPDVAAPDADESTEEQDWRIEGYYRGSGMTDWARLILRVLTSSSLFLLGKETSRSHLNLLGLQIRILQNWSTLRAHATSRIIRSSF